MHCAPEGPSVGDDAGWEALTAGLVPPLDVVSTAALGASDPSWRALQAATFAQRVALLQLAHEPELRRIMRAVGVGTGPRVLEIACGAGVVSRQLLAEGAMQVTALDRDDTAGPLRDRLPRVSEDRLRFHVGRLDGPYPFADDAFDLIWLNGYWFPASVPELQRVLRPDGRVVVTTSGIAPYVTYAFDPAFEARLQAAFRRGYDAMHAAAGRRLPDRTLFGELSTDPRCRDVAVHTELIERTRPLPRSMACYLQQNFALFIGGLLREQVDPADWRRLTALWTPGPSCLLGRPDLHVVQSMVIGQATVGTHTR